MPLKSASTPRYLTVKLFSKNSNLRDHDSQTDGQTDGPIIYT